MVAIALEVLTDAPCPRVGITVTGLGLGDSIVTVWQTHGEAERVPVQGHRRLLLNDSTYLVDYFAPLERPVTYEVEVVSGADGPSRTISAPITVPSTTGWLMDALVPETAVPVVGESKSGIYLRSPALQELEYKANMSVFDIMGSSKRMALFGQRMAETGIDTSLAVQSATENAKLKKLLMSTAHLVFRPLPSWGDLQLAGTLYLGTPVVRQTPLNTMTGGKTTWWDLKSDVVAAPTVKVLAATFSYGDVDMMMDTYQQKQDLMVGKTYLDDLKNPLG